VFHEVPIEHTTLLETEVLLSQTQVSGTEHSPMGSTGEGP